MTDACLVSLPPGPVLVLVDRASNYHAQLAEGLVAVLAEAGVPLVTYLWPTGTTAPERQETGIAPALPDLLATITPAAVVVTPMTSEDDDAHLDAVLAGLPGVPRVYCGVSRGDASVRADNALGMDLLAGHLAGDCGARRFLVVRGLPHHGDSQERMEALNRAFARLGVAAPAVTDGGFDRQVAFRAVRAHLEAGGTADAVIALNDRSALGTIDACQSAGLRVPEDVLVAGFDDEDIATLSQPPLTTVGQDFHEQGRVAAGLVLRLLQGGAGEHIRVPVRLRVRTSTAGGAADSLAELRARSDMLWERLSESDSTMAASRALSGCRTALQAAERIAVALHRHGIRQARLVLPGSRAEGPAVPTLIGITDGSAVILPAGVLPAGQGGPVGSTGLMPLLAGWPTDGGAYAVHPLTMGPGEIGLLATQGDPGTCGLIPETLVMDLARTLGVILRSQRLEDEAAARRAAQEALLRHSHTDPVTGLQNRSAFLVTAGTELDRLRATGATLCLVDLDRFNDVNASMGHAVGDSLLREIATRLGRAAGGRERVFRLGGDDFAVLMPGGRSGGEALEIAARLVAVLEEPISVDGLRLEVDGTVGVACWPWQAEDARALFRMADVALYRAKVGRQETALYDPGDGLEAPRRVALVRALRRALTDRELRVHYQPIADVTGRRVTGVEALLRWQHPEQGLLAPGHFIEIAEQTGLIHPITSFVLDQALRDARAWSDQGSVLRTAVNLSARGLSAAGLAAEVAQVLIQHRIPARQVELEITESAAMADPRRSLAALQELRAIGVDVAVDDFGTGHASLAYLSRLPVTSLKIDRSFVTTMESDRANLTIVRSVLDLARNLGLEVVAEGVETQSAYTTLAQLDPLVQLRAQGYWLSTPVPADTLLDAVTAIDTRLGGASGPGRAGRAAGTGSTARPPGLPAGLRPRDGRYTDGKLASGQP